LCERFHCLPWPGGLFDQDVELLRLVKMVELARPRQEVSFGDGQ